MNLFIIGIQVFGMVLYLVGYRKKETKPKGVPFMLVLGVLLVLWGLLASYLTIVLYNDLVQWTLEPYTRELEIWDVIEYATFGLKSLLLVASGLLFIAT